MRIKEVLALPQPLHVLEQVDTLKAIFAHLKDADDWRIKLVCPQDVIRRVFVVAADDSIRNYHAKIDVFDQLVEIIVEISLSTVVVRLEDEFVMSNRKVPTIKNEIVI